MTVRLDTTHHDRDAVGMTYVYPVVSRRSGGVSVGINLNVNNACNWRCIYCQVPDLKRGGPPPINIKQLEDELRRMLTAIVHGNFMTTSVPEDMRRLNDIALSGNGEPTSAPEFPAVVATVARLLAEFDLVGHIKVVLISNGSLMYRPHVQAGLAQLREIGGEVWFKLDRATTEGLRLVNQTETTPDKVMRNLSACAEMCPTWIQTCLFTLDGQPPGDVESGAYLTFLGQAVAANIPLKGVLLYGLARSSTQPEASRLGRLPADWLEQFAAHIRQTGLTAQTFP
ncbi:MAG: radical SAM protein [Parasulfuritortus sp.]|jgi:wyosine [tRNA(Phe)-imidazoG37] synthetase (radical SAM superfamily)|nr:radical SAM protein [Parasulfuritortus sp.]